MNHNFKAVAFDLDGTLYPDYRLYVRLIPLGIRHARFLTAFAQARNIIHQEQGTRDQGLGTRDCNSDDDTASGLYPDISNNDPQSPVPSPQSLVPGPQSPVPSPQSLSFPHSLVPNYYDRQAQLTAKILKQPPELIKEKIDRLIYMNWPRHFTKIRLFPRAKELLDELRAAKLKLGLLSDFPPRVKLEKLGLSDYWDVVLCSEDCGTLKPAARPFEELARALDCPAEQILYVGNSPRYDVEGARRAGMKTALKTGLFAPKKSGGADFTFSDYRKLRDFMLQ
jgi:putative hydrolase of the HAD superfamily